MLLHRKNLPLLLWGPFLGAPVRPNMLNMPESATDCVHILCQYRVLLILPPPRRLCLYTRRYSLFAGVFACCQLRVKPLLRSGLTAIEIKWLLLLLLMKFYHTCIGSGKSNFRAPERRLSLGRPATKLFDFTDGTYVPGPSKLATFAIVIRQLISHSKFTFLRS